MDEPHEFEQRAQTLAIQAALFRCLRDRGLEPQLSDTLGRRVAPATTFAEQMSRIAMAAEVADELHHGLGLYLGNDERRWVHRVVDAACERFERQQRRERRAARVAMVAASTATTGVVVFRKRDGGSHG
jgi:hypothetical protein